MQIPKITISNFDFRIPYLGPRKASFPYGQFKGLSGVYIVLRDQEIIYVGMSGSCVYTAMYRHFQRWNDSRFDGYLRKTWDIGNGCIYMVSILETDKDIAGKLETELIQRYKPVENDYKMNIPDYEERIANDSIKPTDEVPF